MLDRFMEKVMPEPNSGCWLWVGSVNKDGYGQISVGGRKQRKTLLAHRLSYELHFGEVDGDVVCHSCDVRCCVNPDHLFAGTAKDNILDMKRKGRNAFGEAHGNRVLTEDDVIQIRSSKCTISALAEQFNCSRNAVHSAKTGMTWGHVK